MIFGVQAETVHEALTAAANLIRERGELKDGRFYHTDRIILEIEHPYFRQTTWGKPLVPALRLLDAQLHQNISPLYVQGNGEGTIILEFIHLENVEEVIAASMLLEYENRGSPGKLAIISLYTSVPEKMANPPTPPLDQRDTFSPVWSDDWHRELSMFASEGADAVGYKVPFFRKVAAPIDRGGCALKAAKSTPWIEATRMAE
jgi:hypothetical protein